jgi:hypothetical protein
MNEIVKPEEYVDVQHNSTSITEEQPTELSPQLVEALTEYCIKRDELKQLEKDIKKAEELVKKLMVSNGLKLIDAGDRTISYSERRDIKGDVNKFKIFSNGNVNLSPAIVKKVDMQLVTEDFLRQHNLLEQVSVETLDTEKIKSLIEHNVLKSIDLDKAGIVLKKTPAITMRPKKLK